LCDLGHVSATIFRAVIVASPAPISPNSPDALYHDTGNSAVHIASKQGAF
jgi:hypothetical protein